MPAMTRPSFIHKLLDQETRHMIAISRRGLRSIKTVREEVTMTCEGCGAMFTTKAPWQSKWCPKCCLKRKSEAACERHRLRKLAEKEAAGQLAPEVVSVQVVIDVTPTMEFVPTDAEPGSEEKISIMAERIRNKMPPMHPGDRRVCTNRYCREID